ncbi:MAG: M23 family metallopeptidase [Candidatus Cloacimonetes bacterium]|nr:M23 family metallopeptidase [Candidatus Cloacimonadota bacterium]MBS3766580.1 M23 family metallopeptidase [Candidatus Cloacimonadota bacterium]
MIKKLLLILISTIMLISCSGEKSPKIEKQNFITIKGNIKKGSSLYASLIENNVKPPDAFHATKALNDVYNLYYAQPNDSFIITLDSLNNVHSLKFYHDEKNKYLVEKDSLDTFFAHRILPKANKFSEDKKQKGFFAKLISDIFGGSEVYDSSNYRHSLDRFDIVKGKIRSGSSLYSFLLESNIDYKDAYKITNSLNRQFNLHLVQPNDSLNVYLDSLKQVQILEYFPNNFQTYIVQRDTTGNFVTEKSELTLKKGIETFSTTIKSSLWESFFYNGLEPRLIMDYTDIFQWDIDFFIDTRPGDSCRIIYEVFKNNGDVIKTGKILAASYKGKNFDLTAYHFNTSARDFGYYHADGETFQKAFLKSPLNFSYISSYYGMRLHPITKRYWLHNGVDYAAKRGTPIMASASGTIIYIGWKGGHPTPKGQVGGYGKTVMIRHPNGYKTLYGHLSWYKRGIYVGKKVEQKEIIGYVGSTGWSTGPHLHYTIYQHDRPINPFKLNNVSGPPVPENKMKEFKKVVIKMDTLFKSRFN